MTLIQEAIEALKTQYTHPFTDDDELIQRLHDLGKERTMYDLIDAAEDISFDPKLPSSMTDWASGMFDRLQNGHATVRVRDLNILNAIAEDRQHGLYLLDRMLQEAT